MKIAAYQFAVTSSIQKNLKTMEAAIAQAAHENVRLLVFPECALTGYPPRDMANAAAVDFTVVENACRRLQEMADANAMHIIVGTITKDGDIYRNSAIAFHPDGRQSAYHKRALWGWDRDNFQTGSENGVFEVDEFKIGIRICFEVRFPEYFRELYRQRTDLNVILFYDVADTDDMERYELIKAHIRTRAVENACYTLTADSISPCQTAPTALFDRSGYPLVELERNAPGMLTFDLAKTPPSFGERGRMEISDLLV